MNDTDPFVRDLLEERTPLRTDRHPDWTNVLARAGDVRIEPTGSRQGGSGRRLIVGVALLAAVAIVTTALAASGRLNPFDDVFSPSGPGVGLPLGGAAPAGRVPKKRLAVPEKRLLVCQPGVVSTTAKPCIPTPPCATGQKSTRARPCLTAAESALMAQKTRANPLFRGLPAPTPPFQRASVGGITVIAGANGVVEFRSAGVSPSLEAVLGPRVTYGCFLGGGSGGYEGTLDPTRRFEFGHPLDRCELGTGYGRRWPDRFGSHSAVELAFTPAGRTYFADRAAARDLSLFVRTGLTEAIRRKSGAAVAAAITARHGSRIIRLPSPTAAIASNRIGYVPTPAGAILVEQSPTGKRFSVELEHGYVARQNLRPYTLLVLFQKRP